MGTMNYRLFVPMGWGMGRSATFHLLAEKLGLLQNKHWRQITIGGYYLLEEWIQQHGDIVEDNPNDILVRHATPALVDEMAGISGLYEALSDAAIDWARPHPGGILFPRLAKHLGGGRKQQEPRRERWETKIRSLLEALGRSGESVSRQSLGALQEEHASRFGHEMVFAEPAERSASVPPDVPPNSGGTFREATAEHSAESSRNNCGTFRGTTEKHSASVPPCSARNVPNNKKEGIKSELNTTPSQAGLVSEDEREREDLISWGWEIAQAEKLKDVTGEPVTMGHVQAWVDDRMSSGWERPSGQKIKPENRKADLRKFLSVTRSDKAQKSGISSRIVQEKQAARSAQRKCPLSNGTGKVLVAMRLVEISKGVKVKCPVDISNDWRDGAGVEFVEDQCPCQDCSPTLDEKTRATVMAAVRRS